MRKQRFWLKLGMAIAFLISLTQLIKRACKCFRKISIWYFYYLFYLINSHLNSVIAILIKPLISISSKILFFVFNKTSESKKCFYFSPFFDFFGECLSDAWEIRMSIMRLCLIWIDLKGGTEGVQRALNSILNEPIIDFGYPE